MSCKHERFEQVWREGYEDAMGYHQPGYWEGEYVSTCEDLDLHRYQCTMCGEIMYYSSRAREAYEQSSAV